LICTVQLIKVAPFIYHLSYGCYQVTSLGLVSPGAVTQGVSPMDLLPNQTRQNP